MRKETRRTTAPRQVASYTDLLRRVADDLTSLAEEPLRDAELTLDQWRVLQALADRGPMSMTEVGALTRISGPTLTRVVDRLTERSLLYRNVDTEDRRRVLVHAADRGRQLHRALAPKLLEAERSGLSRLPDAELGVLRQALERLADD
ncbi:MarR family winged helix-turn-helix transcriptional regulator [Kineococcus indalonis]|uniref:MarR family winged helix-turn-helix transcriptional regulator n=1 Tax=Kineococcus indalonis TaxID=2696566 RepID=UPI0014125D6A|nr:MarR family transcriptional regulator [Kineococcus indalonis]NAZ85341.1 MarR family transcriptional regulator [Kineococcus indalonis]